MSDYRFRAECLQDVIEFIYGSIREIGFKKYVLTQKTPFPDVEVELEADMEIEDLRDELRRVPDGHVMVQTLSLKEDYTGKRDFSL